MVGEENQGDCHGYGVDGDVVSSSLLVVVMHSF